MDLSILICSLYKRHHVLDRLLKVLQPQVDVAKDKVEIKIAKDNGLIPVGRKRNLLIQSSSSKYTCFLDDDDLISKDYISKILAAISTNPDCTGLEGEMTTDGKNPRKFIHSLRYDHWYEENGIFLRSPNHLNVIRRDIAIQVPFPEINFGEDHDFSKRVLPLLKTEVYIDGIIYHYLFLSKKL